MIARSLVALGLGALAARTCRGSVLAIAAVAALAVVACGDGGATSAAVPATEPEATLPSPATPPTSTPATTTPSSPTGDGGLPDADAATSITPTMIANASCASAVPAGAKVAPALPAYAGTCPALAAAPSFTTLTSSGASRQVIVFRPQTIAPGETLPVVFLWHWLGGSPEAMGSTLEVQAAVDVRRFIGVIPAPKGDALFRWPFEASQSQARVEEEARFFDDMLACVGAALPVNKDCVSSAGVSAGALWTTQLAVVRSERLSSMVSLSGGTGGVVRPWSPTPHRLPALVLWGGPSDIYPANVPIMNFEKASKNLTSALASDGHFFVECTHNCGHAVPPFDAPAAGSGGLLFDPLWRFVLDHPYWLGASQSPYVNKPLPPFYPAWCGKGQGSATPRPSGAACN